MLWCLCFPSFLWSYRWSCDYILAIEMQADYCMKLPGMPLKGRWLSWVLYGFSSPFSSFDFWDPRQDAGAPAAWGWKLCAKNDKTEREEVLSPGIFVVLFYQPWTAQCWLPFTWKDRIVVSNLFYFGSLFYAVEHNPSWNRYKLTLTKEVKYCLK